MSYVYTTKPAAIPEYFERFRSAGKPPIVNMDWLERLGFNDPSNDRRIIGVLEHINFIKDDGTPTELWDRFKIPPETGAAIAEGIRLGYSDLFQLYEDAYRKDDEALYAYFSASGYADRTIRLMVRTFKELVALADFEAEATRYPSRPPDVEESSEVEEAKAPIVPIAPARTYARYPDININVQLVLPESSDPSIYDELFKSMKKHLFPDEE